MRLVDASPIPPGALLARYSGAGRYADCYTTTLARPVLLAEFVEAFYTGRIFKIERLLLKLFLGKASTDDQVRQLAAGELATFSAWRVEARTADQLLMCDAAGRTRSWLMVAPEASGSGTRLYFGSAVVPVTEPSTGRHALPFGFAALLGFHKLYSTVLLGSARASLERSTR